MKKLFFFLRKNKYIFKLIEIFIKKIKYTIIIFIIIISITNIINIIIIIIIVIVNVIIIIKINVKYQILNKF